MRTFGWYILAALGEIGGCFAFWAWLRLDRSALWTLAGIASLVVFAVALTRVDVAACRPSVRGLRRSVHRRLHSVAVDR